MKSYAKRIDLEFMELDSEPRLTHWEAFILGLAKEVDPVRADTDSSAFAEGA